MTIAGDLDVIVNLDKPTHDRVKAIFDFLSSADVIVYLQGEDGIDLYQYLNAIRVLKKKCAW